MGWGGQGLGAKESVSINIYIISQSWQGIVEPINPGEVRDKVSQFRGLGSAMDPYEEFRLVIPTIQTSWSSMIDSGHIFLFQKTTQWKLQRQSTT